MDIAESGLLNISVTVCDRPYRLKVKPEEEENVRTAAKQLNERIKELQSQFLGKDKQDYLVMTALSIMVEKLGKENSPPEQGTDKNLLSQQDDNIINDLQQLDQKIQQALSI